MNNSAIAELFISYDISKGIVRYENYMIKNYHKQNLVDVICFPEHPQALSMVLSTIMSETNGSLTNQG